MLSLKIKGDKFYVLKLRDEKWIYCEEDIAIKALRDHVSKDKNLKPNDISILEVTIKGEKWEIVQVPWSKIVLKLIRGE